MIDVALPDIIRRWHSRDQIPLREIARRLGVSRNTVRRYLRSEVAKPAYAERQTTSAIDVSAICLSKILSSGKLPIKGSAYSVKVLILYNGVTLIGKNWDLIGRVAGR